MHLEVIDDDQTGERLVEVRVFVARLVDREAGEMHIGTSTSPEGAVMLAEAYAARMTSPKRAAALVAAMKNDPEGLSRVLVLPKGVTHIALGGSIGCRGGEGRTARLVWKGGKWVLAE